MSFFQDSHYLSLTLSLPSGSLSPLPLSLPITQSITQLHSTCCLGASSPSRPPRLHGTTSSTKQPL
ncbi:hypothetical protein Mapa_011921 [Marchantia paleacea]|nr:hypothetical protein Mapa_011921 [Marchantia paleacea]